MVESYEENIPFIIKILDIVINNIMIKNRVLIKLALFDTFFPITLTFKKIAKENL